MRYTRFRKGPAAKIELDEVLVIATRFTFKHLRHMPLIIAHGMRLRNQWGNTPGAVGVSVAADILGRTTYSISVWDSEDSFRQWFLSDYHASLVKAYRKWVESSDSVRWHTGHFVPGEGWRQAMQRLTAPA